MPYEQLTCENIFLVVKTQGKGQLSCGFVTGTCHPGGQYWDYYAGTLSSCSYYCHSVEDQGIISLMFFHHNLNSMEISFYSHLYSIKLIVTTFCTCHGICKIMLRYDCQEQSYSKLEVGWKNYYDDVIMIMMASQITSLTIVYWTIYSGADQRKPQSSASLAFVRGIHRQPLNSPHKWPVMWKMFPFDDVIMLFLKQAPGPILYLLIHVM